MEQERASQQLRLPVDLKGWITEQAKRNGRSSNSEIVQRLKESKLREEANAPQ